MSELKKLTLIMDANDHKQLKIIAAQKEISVAYVIRQLIKGFLENMKDHNGE